MKNQKVIWILLFCFLGLSSIHSTMTMASELKEYRSNVEVGFYGTYQYGKEQVPEVPENYPDSEPKKYIKTYGTSQRILPKTGENHSSYLGVIGFITLVSVMILFKLKKLGGTNQ